MTPAQRMESRCFAFVVAVLLIIHEVNWLLVLCVAGLMLAVDKHFADARS